MASGDEGVFGAGRGDMRAVAETNGEAEEPDLLHNKKHIKSKVTRPKHRERYLLFH